MNRQNFRDFLRKRGLIVLGLVLILAFNFAIRWRLCDMPLERDEGEYAYAGQLILQGIPPYQLAYNMKFPGTYAAYAALMAVFGETPEGIHFGMILVISISALLVFLIGRELMSAAGGLVSAASFVCLSSLPAAGGLAGQATHFVVLFVCAGTFALLKTRQKSAWIWSATGGVAFGLAILMKQHALFFPLFALGWLIWSNRKNEDESQKKSTPLILAFCVGCVVPLLITAAAFAWAGVWQAFVFWTIQYARQYVSMIPLAAAGSQFVRGFWPIFASSWPIWILGAAGFVLLLKKHRWKTPLGVCGWLFVAGMLAACPGFYFRGHYFIPAMPGVALLTATSVLIFADRLKEVRPAYWSQVLPGFLVCLMLGELAAQNSQVWFKLTPRETVQKLYPGNPFPEAAEIARYLRKHTSPNQTIQVLGSEPEIYFLARRHAASGYIYTYALTEPQPLAVQMRRQFMDEIEAASPQYIVFVNIFGSWFSTIQQKDRSQSINSIPEWWSRYSKNYQLVGVVDLHEGKPAEFFLDNQATNQSSFSPNHILIFRRMG